MNKERVIVSFSGRCEMNCKHCFALEQEKDFQLNDVDSVVNSLEHENFDIIYVSHNKENFYKPWEGVELCEKLYYKYRKDLCITSRCVLDDNSFDRMVRLNDTMKKEGHDMFWCISIPALERAYVTEDFSKVPSPQERISFLEKIKLANIYSILTIRPLFPEQIISHEEIKNLLDLVQNCIDVVITGGLVVTDYILERLCIESQDLQYYEGNESQYLVGAISENARFVDVHKEKDMLRKYCEKLNIVFFEHSMEAINYLKSANHM